jgi:hypothetical protein
MCVALEAWPPIGVGAQFSRRELDCDRAIEAGVAGAVYLAHPTGAEEGEDFVGAETSADGKGHAEPDPRAGGSIHPLRGQSAGCGRELPC